MRAAAAKSQLAAKRFSDVMVWEVERHDTRTADALARALVIDPLRWRRIFSVKSAFLAAVAVGALSARQRWTDTVGVDDSLSRELVTTTVTSSRTGICMRAPLRRERDLEEHQGSTRSGQRRVKARVRYQPWRAFRADSVYWRFGA